MARRISPLSPFAHTHFDEANMLHYNLARQNSQTSNQAESVDSVGVRAIGEIGLNATKGICDAFSGSRTCATKKVVQPPSQAEPFEKQKTPCRITAGPDTQLQRRIDAKCDQLVRASPAGSPAALCGANSGQSAGMPLVICGGEGSAAHEEPARSAEHAQATDQRPASCQ